MIPPSNAEVEEKYVEAIEDMDALRVVDTIPSVQKAFRAFSNTAGSVFLMIEENIPDFKDKKGTSKLKQDYRAILAAQNLCHLFRSIRNVNTHARTLHYVGKTTMGLTPTLYTRASLSMTFRSGDRSFFGRFREFRTNAQLSFRDAIGYLKWRLDTVKRRLVPLPVVEPTIARSLHFNAKYIDDRAKGPDKLSSIEVTLCEQRSVLDLSEEYARQVRKVIDDSVALGVLK